MRRTDAAALLVAALSIFAACAHDAPSPEPTADAEPCAGIHKSLAALEREVCRNRQLLLRYSTGGGGGTLAVELCDSGLLSWFRSDGLDHSASIQLRPDEVRSFLESLELDRLEGIPADVELAMASDLPSTCLVWRERRVLKAIYVYGPLNPSSDLSSWFRIDPAPPAVLTTVERIHAVEPSAEP